MALFKPMYGSSTDLTTQALHDGYAYFTTDDGKFYIDYAVLANGTPTGEIQRKAISALGHVTAGTDMIPVYFNNGVPTACNIDLSPITGDMIREITGHYDIYLESEVQV